MYLPAYHTAQFAQKVLHKVWTEFVAPQSLCLVDSSNKLIRKKMPSLDAFPFRLIWVKINLIYRAHIFLICFRPVSHSQARLIVISHPFICSLWRSISQPLCSACAYTHTHTHTHTHSPSSGVMSGYLPAPAVVFSSLSIFSWLMLREFKCHSFLIGCVYRSNTGCLCSKTHTFKALAFQSWHALHLRSPLWATQKETFTGLLGRVRDPTPVCFQREHDSVQQNHILTQSLPKSLHDGFIFNKWQYIWDVYFAFLHSFLLTSISSFINKFIRWFFRVPLTAFTIEWIQWTVI